MGFLKVVHQLVTTTANRFNFPWWAPDYLLSVFQMCQCISPEQKTAFWFDFDKESKVFPCPKQVVYISKSRKLCGQLCFLYSLAPFFTLLGTKYQVVVKP